MALYIGNNKIASLSQTINPEMLGDGLSVGTDGTIQIVGNQILQIINNTIAESDDDGESEEGDAGGASQFIQQIYEKLQTMINTGTIQGTLGGGNMIDTKSSTIFYQPPRQLRYFADPNVIDRYSGMIGIVEENEHILSVKFPKNMRITYKSDAQTNICFNMDDINLLPNAPFSSLPNPTGNTASISGWGDSLEFDIQKDTVFYVVNRRKSGNNNIPISQTTTGYLGFFPIQPYVQTKYEDTLGLTYGFEQFMPWNRIFQDEDLVDSITDDPWEQELLKAACLSDAINFIGPIGTNVVTTQIKATDWSPITKETLNSGHSALSMALNTDVDKLYVSFPQFTSNAVWESSTATSGSEVKEPPAKKYRMYYWTNSGSRYIIAAYVSTKKYDGDPTLSAAANRCGLNADNGSMFRTFPTEKLKDAQYPQRIGFRIVKDVGVSAISKSTIPKYINSLFYCPKSTNKNWQRNSLSSKLENWRGQVRLDVSISSLVQHLKDNNPSQDSEDSQS